MHKRKIDMADEIYVINVGDYIGESTRSEIAYARAQGKIVRYLEPHVDTVVGPVRQVTENIGDLQEDEEDMLACLQDAAQRASEPDRQPDRQPDWNDYAGLEEFLRASARGNGVSGVVPPDEATAAMIAWQTGEENDEEPQEEESAATSKEAYALQMLRDGYDIGNTAYFIGEDEAFVRALMQEHHLTEDDLRRFL